MAHVHPLPHRDRVWPVAVSVSSSLCRQSLPLPVLSQASLDVSPHRQLPIVYGPELGEASPHIIRHYGHVPAAVQTMDPGHRGLLCQCGAVTRHAFCKTHPFPERRSGRRCRASRFKRPRRREGLNYDRNFGTPECAVRLQLNVIMFSVKFTGTREDCREA